MGCSGLAPTYTKLNNAKTAVQEILNLVNTLIVGYPGIRSESAQHESGPILQSLDETGRKQRSYISMRKLCDCAVNDEGGPRSVCCNQGWRKGLLVIKRLLGHIRIRNDVAIKVEKWRHEMNLFLVLGLGLVVRSSRRRGRRRLR